MKPNKINNDIIHNSFENSEIKNNEKKRANIESRKSMFESSNQFKAQNSDMSHQKKNIGT